MLLSLSGKTCIIWKTIITEHMEHNFSSTSFRIKNIWTKILCGMSFCNQFKALNSYCLKKLSAIGIVFPSDSKSCQTRVIKMLR